MYTADGALKMQWAVRGVTLMLAAILLAYSLYGIIISQLGDLYFPDLFINLGYVPLLVTALAWQWPLLGGVFILATGGVIVPFVNSISYWREMGDFNASVGAVFFVIYIIFLTSGLMSVVVACWKRRCNAVE